MSRNAAGQRNAHLTVSPGYRARVSEPVIG